VFWQRLHEVNALFSLLVLLNSLVVFNQGLADLVNLIEFTRLQQLLVAVHFAEIFFEGISRLALAHKVLDVVVEDQGAEGCGLSQFFQGDATQRLGLGEVSSKLT
jgi:hypothetical protein